MTKIKAGIVGATGFTGAELVRLLYQHPMVEIEAITSESKTGASFADIHPHFYHIIEQSLRSADTIPALNLDVVFLALPHGVSMEYVKKFAETPLKIIDLSGDFRLSGKEIYEHWYNKPHHYPEGFGKSAYGLPELHGTAIRESYLIANPGCYPTSSIIALAPLVKNGLIREEEIIIDAKSGVTGAGVKPKPGTHFSSVNDNFNSYGLKKHRHTVEIEEQLTQLSAHNITLQFTPHLLPVDRGILATVYTRPKQSMDQQLLDEVYQDFYAEHPFVRWRQSPPGIKDVRGTNYCDLYAVYDERTDRIITLSAIDNLVKGAAGQAIQNMNIMFNLDERMGLDVVPMKP